MAAPLLDALQARLGNAFVLRSELTGGGMSRVFLGHEAALKRDVVVKVLPPDLVSTLSLARFRREIEVTAQLQHPHILPVITAGGDEGLLYYVTPYIRGESLKARMAEGPLPAAEAARITREVLLAVRFAHARGVVHRDIKPGNVLLSDGHAILADFGIARALTDPDAPHPGPSGSSAAGSLAYLAPERPRDETADLYAVGVLLREMLATAPGGPPVEGLRAVAATATAVDPAARWATADAFLGALEATAGRRAWPRPVLAGVFLLGLLSTGLVAWNATHRAAPPDPALARTDTFPTPTFVPADTPLTTPSRPPRSLLDSAGRAARRGRSDLAIPLLRELTAAEPENARAWVALATALTWSSLPTHQGEARAAAIRAAALADRLDRHDALVAQALMAQNEERFPEACAAFDSARAVRPDFVTWFGAAECRQRDERVESSEGRMHFRGDPTLAARYYEEAWRRAEGIAPNTILSRLQSVLPTQQGQVRRGTTAQGEVWFGMPLADGDSLRWELQPAGPRRMTPEVLQASRAAAAIARARIRPLLLAWAAQTPRDPAAHYALAELLENDGTIDAAGPEGVTALSEIQKAAALGVDPAWRLDAVRTEVRILLRARRWAAAADLADSVLAAIPTADNVQAEFLVGLAAVTGQVERAAALARQQGGMPQRQVRGPDGRELPLPAAITNERIGFGIRAAAGICTEEQRTAPGRLMAALDVASPAATRPRGLEAAYLERPLMLALDCLGPDGTTLLPQPMLPPVQVARALSVGDTVRARGLLAALEVARQRGGSAPLTMDLAVAEALARLQVRDSSGARRVLAEGVAALSLAPPQFLHNEHPAAALGRGLALKAELDAAAGEMASARESAAAALALWQKADPALGPAVERLRRLVGP